jgi:hypothetical protein
MHLSFFLFHLNIAFGNSLSFLILLSASTTITITYFHDILRIALALLVPLLPSNQQSDKFYRSKLPYHSNEEASHQQQPQHGSCCNEEQHQEACRKSIRKDSSLCLLSLIETSEELCY